MGYKKAVDVLPQEVLALIQEYIDGEYIYIPRKMNTKKAWGEKTQTKQMYEVRNKQIFKDYQTGIDVIDIAKKYHLSPKTVQGIISSLKKKIA